MRLRRFSTYLFSFSDEHVAYVKSFGDILKLRHIFDGAKAGFCPEHPLKVRHRGQTRRRQSDRVKYMSYSSKLTHWPR